MPHAVHADRAGGRGVCLSHISLLVLENGLRECAWTPECLHRVGGEGGQCGGGGSAPSTAFQCPLPHRRVLAAPAGRSRPIGAGRMQTLDMHLHCRVRDVCPLVLMSRYD